MRFARRNVGKLVGKRPDEEKEILEFFKEIFSANFNYFSGKIFSRLSKYYRAEERKFCVLEKLLFDEIPEEEGT